jgi:hypothetical protein
LGQSHTNLSPQATFERVAAETNCAAARPVGARRRLMLGGRAGDGDPVVACLARLPTRVLTNLNSTKQSSFVPGMLTQGVQGARRLRAAPPGPLGPAIP